MSRPDDDPTQAYVPKDNATPPQPLGLDDFRKALADLKLIDPADLADLEARHKPADATALASALVREGKLTRYQAAALYQGKAKGLVLGEYLILDKVGAGGMGMVFKARNRSDGRVGALKVLPPSLTRDAASVQRFRREASAVAKLNHPNLVAGFDTVDYQGVHYYVMEYVAGKDLHKVVQEGGPLPVGRAIDYLIQAAKGLKAAHEAGIIHRDIKPSNLMLDDSGTVKVLDLGLARLTEDYSGQTAAKDRITQTGMLMGTADYMAPEQADDSHRADHRADIYALGCTLYFLATGQPPYAGASPLRKLIAHLEAPIPHLRDRCPDAPKVLEDLFRKMLAKKPEDRPFSAASVIVALETCKAAIRPPSSSGQKTLLAFGADEPTARIKGAANPDKYDPSVFGDDRQAVRINPDLNLEDLLTDVRPDVHAPPPGTVLEPPPLPLPRKQAPRRKFSRKQAGGLGAISGLVVVAGCVAAILYLKPWAGESASPDGSGASIKAVGNPEPPKSPDKVKPPAEPAYATLFGGDGKDLNGWVARNADSGSSVSKYWNVQGFILHGQGGRSHLFSPRADYKDVRVRAEMKINAGGNSGLFIRAGDAQPFPNGYEAQVNSTVDGPKTGSLYVSTGRAKTVDPSPVPSETWFTIEVEAVGNHIRVWVDGKITSDYVDESRRYNSGAIALQVHDDKTHVQVRKVEVMDLSAGGSAPSAAAKPAAPKPAATKSHYPRPEGKLLLADDFGNPRSGWPAQSAEDVARPANHHHYYADGHYRLDASSDGWWSWHTGHRFNDMDCRTTGRIVGDSPASRGSFGAQIIPNDEEHGFQVVINGEGELFIQPAKRTSEKHKDSPWIGPIRHKAIKAGGGDWNEIRLVLKGRKLDVSVNGETVAPTVELGWDPTPARIELTLFSDVPGCRAEFDSIQVYEIPPESADPNSPLNRGLALSREKKYAEAIPALREAILREPRNAQAHQALVNSLRFGNQVDAAVEAWRDLLKLSGSAPGYASLAQYLYQNGRNREAADAAREAVRIQPTLHEGYSILGLALSSQKDRPGSIDAHRKGLIAQPNCANCRNNLAWTLASEEDPARRRANLPEALTLAREAVRLQPNEWANQHTLGVVEYRSGNLDAALEALQKSMDARKGGDANEWVYMAMIAHKKGDAGGARKWLEKGQEWIRARKPSDIDDDLKQAEAEAAALLAGTAAAEPEPPKPPKPPATPAIKTITNAIGMKLVLIQPGEFDMGAPASDARADPQEKPRHKVKITRPFYLGETEVTRAQYLKLRDKDPSKFRDADDLPVEQVSWFEAAAYCNALSVRDKLEPYYRIEGERVTTQGRLGDGYRLPTEAEWEYACLAGSVMPFSFGPRAEDLGDFAWFQPNGGGKTHPAAGKKPNAWGLFDMHGNVWEWVGDRYEEGYYGRSPASDPPGPAKSDKYMIRGGSWVCDSRLQRATSRLAFKPDYRAPDVGFRVARNAPTKGGAGR